MAGKRKKKDDAIAAPENTDLDTFDYGDDAGSGHENIDQSHYQIPFLVLLQKISPQCEDEDSGHKPGMIWNSVSEESVSGSDGLVFVPVKVDRKFVEWRPRDAGGGFVGHHEPSSDLVKHAVATAERFGKNKTTDGNDLVETYYVYAVLENGDGVLIAFTSTKIKAYRRWISRLSKIRVGKNRDQKPPLWAFRTRVTSAKRQNEQGTYYVFDLAFAEKDDAKSSLIAPDSDLFQAGKTFAAMIAKGAVEVNYDKAKESNKDEDESFNKF